MKTTKASFDVLILDGHARQALVAVRLLGQHGLRVAVMGYKGENTPAFSSKWCSKAVECPHAEATDEYAEFLLTFLKENKVRVLIPSSDGTVEILQKYRTQIEKYTKIALGSGLALQKAIDKEKTLKIAEKLGMKVPQTIVVKTAKGVDSAVKKLGLPLVVKPPISWTEGTEGQKRLISALATTLDEAKAAYVDLSGNGYPVLFQQYLSGSREAISVFYAHKTFHAIFSQWAKRTQPPLGGMSVLRESTKVPRDTGAQTKKLIKAIGLEGYSEVEFRRDEDGYAYLMEINPRMSASIDIAVQAGVPFPYMIYQWARALTIDTVSTYQTGLWERYFAGDLVNAVQSIQQRGRPGIEKPSQVIADFFISTFTPMKYDYVDTTDLKPTLTALTNFVTRNVRKVKNFNS
jgi:predicted ATP-grasp superfamily ATP-dependent carboligase